MTGLSTDKLTLHIMNRVGHYDVESLDLDNANGGGVYTSSPGFSPTPNGYDGRKSIISNKRLHRRQYKAQSKHNIQLDHFVKTPSLSQRLREISQEEKLQLRLKKKNSKWSGSLPCCSSLKNLREKVEFWGSSIRSIEGHQGTGVISFFILLRWLFGMNLALFVISFGFLNLPILLFDQQSYYLGVEETFIEQCTANYTVKVSDDGLQLFLDFFLGSGWMEKTPVFFGYYPGKYMTDGSYIYNFPLAYLFVIIICLLLSVFLMARYSVKAFRKNALADEQDTLYTAMVYCSWDYSLKYERVCETKKRKLRYTLASEMQDQRFLKNRDEKMEQCPYRCMLYLVRIIVNLFVIACLGGAGYAIFKASEFSSSWTTVNTVESGTNKILLFLVEFLPSITITVLNAVLPLVFEIVIMAERYTQDFVIKLSLVRTVFLKLASVAILIASIYTGVISCTTKDSCGSITAPCPSITLSALYACEPPNRPYRTTRNNNFFMIVLIFTFFLSSFPVIYAISNISSSHGCGPFRVYDFPYMVVGKGIEDVQLEGFTIAYTILTSPAVTSSLIIILLVLLFYCSKLRIAHKDTVKFLRDKIVIENHDRQNMFEELKKYRKIK
ncbi:hypothetical protein LOTGIDRAFT_228949 [Lottia gigantea]|uniref:TMC domain-containing protein n=1 Tax=Lottia gigantea TaxID=225164 RepID=V3ZXA7_LOTGI|nr:hypothetical protein LOTGIDRAFT_228949 [Lottia gigantea]ESO89007.1 hypothetical protein LOTGIDRAFT_228949 [Lottia gigantea]